MSEPENPEERSAKFGLGSLICLVVANTIGAGVYTTSGFTLKDLGTPEAVLLIWLAASVLALAGAISFGALSRAIPESGGEYVYLSRLLHPSLGFIAGWVSLIAAFAGAKAYAAITFMEYIHFEDRRVELAIAVALIILLSSLHGLLVKAGTILQNLTVAAKAIFILGFVGLGAALIDQPPTTSVVTAEVSWWAWPVNLMWVSLSFTGFNSAIYVAEECENPRRDIPKALFLGTSITAILYLLINAVFMYSAPVSELAATPDIALVSARALGGSTLERAVQILVLLSLFTLMSGMAVAGPRVVVKMGEDGFLPPLSLRKAALIQCGIAVFMTVQSDLVSQLTYLSLTLSLSSALTIASVFRLPREDQPNPIFPVVYILGTAVSAVASLQTQQKAGIAAIATIGSGLLVYFVFFHKKQKSRMRTLKEAAETREPVH